MQISESISNPLRIRCRIEPYAHQIEGTQKIINNPYFMLADEMGAGKTKQAIDAAQALFDYGVIDNVLIIAPASVRAVWFDPDLGEIAKHFWADTGGVVLEYHTRDRAWRYGDINISRRMHWLITNYDYVRTHDDELSAFCTSRTFLILDESSAIKNHQAQQTKATLRLRLRCGRVLLMNGTPIANNPGDLFSQGQIMNPNILGCKSWTYFRSRYAVMGGYLNKQIVQWINLEDLQRRFAPYVLRRLKKDCLDLPPKLPPTILTATLTPATWKIYRDMRDELVVWLSDQTASVAAQAVVKALRLSQIASGFVGGIESLDNYDKNPEVQEVGREKLDVFLQWYTDQLQNEPNLKLLVWCRFRMELARLYNETSSKFPKVATAKIWGNQNRHERGEALKLLDPRTTPSGPVLVSGTPSSGALGLNLTAANHVVYCSNDYSLRTRLQSEDRVHRPGQTRPVVYLDIIATGPQGQKTIDHTIIKALREKQNLANWTTSAWIKSLTEE
jgi:SNF2 family DNA or RNA helicase